MIKDSMKELEEDNQIKSNSNNEKLLKASKIKNDEFYTYYKDIEEEMGSHKETLKNKIIYLPCDNPSFSNFYRYFKDNFDNLKLKKLICTYLDENPKVYIFDGKETIMADNEDGDFRADCNRKYFIEADFIITNPPFSIKQDLLDIIEEYNKNFIMILPFTHLATDNCYEKMINREYKINSRVEEFYSLNSNDTKKVRCYFFNNLKDFKTTNNPKVKVKFNKYDNYDAIECPKIEYFKFLKDYKGNIGLPITILLNIDDYINDYEFIDKVRPKLNGKELFIRVIIRKK